MKNDQKATPAGGALIVRALRKVRWLARAAFKRITGLYYRDIMRQQRDIRERLDQFQHQVTLDLQHISHSVDQFQHQATFDLRHIEERLDQFQHQVTVGYLETQGEVMDLMLRRLRALEEEIAGLAGPVTVLAGKVSLVQDQISLLRAHLYASGILGPVSLKIKTLQRVFEEANASTPQEGAVVEIGCIRYPFESPLEGASTLYFARWCQEANRKFVSIDVERAHLENARRLLDEQDLAADLVHADGQEAISNLSVPIGLLYLDGSNDPNETLEQFKAAEDKLTARAIVALDDVQQIDSNSMGKGESAIPYARERGWEVELLDTDPGYRMAVLRRPAGKRVDDRGKPSSAS